MKHWGLNDNIFEYDTIHIQNTYNTQYTQYIYENYDKYADIL